MIQTLQSSNLSIHIAHVLHTGCKLKEYRLHGFLFVFVFCVVFGFYFFFAFFLNAQVHDLYKTLISTDCMLFKKVQKHVLILVSSRTVTIYTLY